MWHRLSKARETHGLSPADGLAARPTPPAPAERAAADAAMVPRHRFDAPWLTPDFANDHRRAVVCDARVLLCADAVEDARELTRTLGRIQAAGRSVVFVAPAFDDAAARMVIMNHRTNTVPALCVLAEDAGPALAERVGVTEPSTRADRLADYLPVEMWGDAAVWVSDRHHSWVVPPG